METHSISKINMETANLSPTEWREKFIIISKEELELSKKSANDRRIFIENYDNHDEDDDDNDDDDDDDDKYIILHDNLYCTRKQKAQYDLRMIKMDILFASQPRLKKICQNWKNGFLTSCFTKYTFKNYANESLNELYETANDPEYLINLCGTYLTHLDVRGYPLSQIMPIINANCPNLETLYSGFKEIMSQDFENVFSNMSHLGKLFIEWECENSTLPMTLVKSLKQIGGTLESLELSCPLDRYDIFLPDSLASVFPRLIALEFLCIRHLGLSQILLQSIGEMKNLVDLRLMFAGEKDHPMFDKKVNMYPIGNLKNLEKLYILYDYGVTDEFLINLCNNAKKLEDLHIIGINITDIGMSAIDNLQELKFFFLGLCILGSQSEKNEYITDESIQCLFNQKLISLDISNCINVTDKGVIKLVKNLPTLDTLSIRNTKVTSEGVRKIKKLTEHRKEVLCVYENIETDN